MSRAWPWLVLALLGAYHGLNPGMGWLFALSLGLQEKKRSAVVWALVPIAVGHAAAITLAILSLRFVQYVLPLQVLKVCVAVLLFALGGYRIFRASHPRGAGMRVGAKDLAVWSFLMATAHGAGLMLMPVLIAPSMVGMSHSMVVGTPAVPPSLHASVIALAVLVHTTALLVVAGLLALLVYGAYEKTGLQLLRRAWINFDVLWAFALIVAGVVTLML